MIAVRESLLYVVRLCIIERETRNAHCRASNCGDWKVLVELSNYHSKVSILRAFFPLRNDPHPRICRPAIDDKVPIAPSDSIFYWKPYVILSVKLDYAR